MTCLVQVCKLPTILAHPWFERLVGDSTSRLVSKQGFLEWWLSRRLVTAPPSKRLWEVLRPEGRHHLTYADFRPLLQVGAWWRWWFFGEWKGGGGHTWCNRAAVCAGQRSAQDSELCRACNCGRCCSDASWWVQPS